MKHINLQNTDKTFWTIYALLLSVAVIAMFSASSMLVYKDHSVLGPIGTQIVFMLVGVAVAFGLQFVPSKYIRLGGYVLLFVSILMVWSLLLPNKLNPFIVSLNGEKRWLRLFGQNFQPSELVKLSLLIVVADMLSRGKTDKDKRKYFLYTLGLTVLAVFPIMVSNLSTAVLICVVVFLLWILGQVSWKYLASTAAATLLLATIGICIIEFGYVRKGKEITGMFSRAVTWVGRVDRWLDKSGTDDKTAKFEITDTNRQEVYAKVAIARGGKSPVGVLPGNSKERDYLPLAYADYIFAIVVEESGICGAIFVIILYLSLLARACFASSRYSDMAAMLMVMGLALMITCQALVSMLVAVDVGPVTGQPLPLISRGGTSMLIVSAYFGIMMGVSREQVSMRNRQQATIEDSRNDVPDIVFE